MARVVFEKSLAGPAAELERFVGPLMDACDEAAAPVPFSCRSISCGTCRIDVLEGAACLDAVGAEERDVLCLFDDTPGPRRLACAARVLAVEGLVRLKATEDW